jgi:hypothetical protein
MDPLTRAARDHLAAELKALGCYQKAKTAREADVLPVVLEACVRAIRRVLEAAELV